MIEIYELFRSFIVTSINIVFYNLRYEKKRKKCVCAVEKQMRPNGKHCCIKIVVVILSNADLISDINIYTEEYIYGTALGRSFYKRNRPACI